jgi:ferredoxin
MPEGKRLRVEHDADACVGHGRCYELAPAVFDEDDCGHGVLKTASLAAELEGQARLAAENCPEDAITLRSDA